MNRKFKNTLFKLKIFVLVVPLIKFNKYFDYPFNQESSLQCQNPRPERLAPPDNNKQRRKTMHMVIREPQSAH
jgi:hypothetical protein